MNDLTNFNASREARTEARINEITKTVRQRKGMYRHNMLVTFAKRWGVSEDTVATHIHAARARKIRHDGVKYVVFLLLFMFACGVMPAPALPTQTATAEIAQATQASRQTYTVRVDTALNVRNGAGGQETGSYFYGGELVEIYQRETVDSTEWCAINASRSRWVACRFLK